MGKRISLVVSAIVLVGALGVAGGRWWRSTSSTTTTATTTTTMEESVQQPAAAMWPFVSSANRFRDPIAVAMAFATDYLGFATPIVGAFHWGDTRSGEVQVRSSATGPVTTILVRRLTSDNSWWVLGASCADVVVRSPVWNQSISSPLSIRGRSTAFEAVVNVELRQDGSLRPLASTTVRGGSMGVMGPFATSISFPMASSRAGALVVRTLSPKDGHVLVASALRISFAR